MQKIASSIEKTGGKGKSDCVEMVLRLKNIDDPQMVGSGVLQALVICPKLMAWCANGCGKMQRVRDF
jgi:hypothetical protein